MKRKSSTRGKASSSNTISKKNGTTREDKRSYSTRESRDSDWSNSKPRRSSSKVADTSSRAGRGVSKAGEARGGAGSGANKAGEARGGAGRGTSKAGEVRDGASRGASKVDSASQFGRATSTRVQSAASSSRNENAKKKSKSTFSYVNAQSKKDKPNVHHKALTEVATDETKQWRIGQGGARRQEIAQRIVSKRYASASSPNTEEECTTDQAASHSTKKSSHHIAHQINDIITLDIVGLTHDGEGVGRADGYTLFVPGALPNEKVKVRVTSTKKNYGYAELLEVENSSISRIEPVCAIYDECGGCQLQHLSYEEELIWKRQFVIDNLVRIGKLNVTNEIEASSNDQNTSTVEANGVVVHSTIGMPNPWRYRNKAAVPIGPTESGSLVGGFYAKGSHQIVEMQDCHIQHEQNDVVIREVKEIAKELRVVPYDEATATGVLRHIMVRVGVVTGEVMIVLITNTHRLPRQPEWIEHIRSRIPNVKSIVHNINDKVTNAIFGDITNVVWGKDVIYDELDGIRFAISARSFYQVNPEQTISLYSKAVEYAALTGKEQVIDAYCGIGTISLFLARQAAHVYGVEIVPEAIEDAKRNAELNGLTNTTFEAGPAEVVIPRWKKEGMKADVIVVDPPRKGCDPALLETILAIQPKRVVYVSCNSATLARDLRVLEDGGYRTVEVTPVDMFPQSGHVECCSLLVRKV